MIDGTGSLSFANPLLRISNLTKYFGATLALDDVSLEVRGGEIHGLVGQNGSGKSTIIKCLSGYHSQDLYWRLGIRDRVLTRALHPGEIASYGLSFVHQDLAMLPELSVLENLLITEMAASNRPFISWPKERRRAREIFVNFGLDLDPAAKLGSLRPVEQAQVAIIRAAMQLRAAKQAQHQPGVLVLDEATTFLDQVGREGVHSLLKSVAATGDGVIFVSHDISEILKMTDRVTVLRDGKVVETAPTSTLSHDDIVALIVGGTRSPGFSQFERRATQAVVGPLDLRDDLKIVAGSTFLKSSLAPSKRLKVDGMTGDHINNVSIEAASGQIMGVTGIVGSGWEFFLEYLFGARSAIAGHVEVDGRREELESMTPVKARGMSMVLVPSDRLSQAIVTELSVEDNVMQPALRQVFRGGRLRLRELTSKCMAILNRYSIVPQDPKLSIASLSGGNQQKAVIVKWLETGPSYVLLNEPTQGVDVGARQRIYELVRSAADRGAVVLYASADWEEVVRISDRVVVLADGRISEELDGDSISVENIARAAYLGTRKSADLSKASSLWSQ